jgi:D-alanyl-D-alanine carboxypeptidase
MDQAQKYLQGLINHGQTPCVSYYIFDKDNIIYQFREGVADIGNQRKVNDTTTFNAFSVTKTFTALAILQLADNKRLDTSQPVKHFLSNFPYDPGITIQHLLNHSAGIPNPIPLGWIHLRQEHASFNRNQFFKTIMERHNKTKWSPNKRFAYSNLGYFILGRIIENITGIRYEQYIIDNIIRPLGLLPKELDFTINDTAEHAKGYVKQASFLNMLLTFFIDKSKYMSRAEGSWKPFKDYYVNGPSYGGLIGTPMALVKYIQELLKPGCSLISEPYKRLLFTENFTSDRKATGMCTSWFSGKLNGKQYFAHAGGGGGYYSEIRLYPGIGTGSVIMFNRTGMKDERFLNNIDRYFVTDK